MLKNVKAAFLNKKASTLREGLKVYQKFS